jgi:hypothetical protein
MINKKMLQSARKHEVQSKLQDITQVEASQHLASSIPIDLNWTTLTFAFISIHLQMISTILAFKHFHKVLISKNLVPRKNWLRQQNISEGNKRTTIINTQLTNSIGNGLISTISVVQFFDFVNNLWFCFKFFLEIRKPLILVFWLKNSESKEPAVKGRFFSLVIQFCRPFRALEYASMLKQYMTIKYYLFPTKLYLQSSSCQLQTYLQNPQSRMQTIQPFCNDQQCRDDLKLIVCRDQIWPEKFLESNVGCK